MSDRVKQFIHERAEGFRAELEASLRELLEEDNDSVVVNLQVSFSFSITPRIRVQLDQCGYFPVDFARVDTSKVPTYKWQKSEIMEMTEEPVTTEAIAAAIERMHDEPLLVRLLKVLAGNNNTPLTRDELKALKAPDSFHPTVKQLLRCAGVPFTIHFAPRESVDDHVTRYKLFSVKPPKLYR